MYLSCEQLIVFLNFLFFIVEIFFSVESDEYDEEIPRKFDDDDGGSDSDDSQASSLDASIIQDKVNNDVPLSP
jgi:hypothetical protein